MEDIEVLVLTDDISLEDIFKQVNKFDFPALTVTPHKQVCFNTAAGKTGLIGSHILWKVSTEYVIGLPATEKDKGAYVVWDNSKQRSVNSKSATLPNVLATEKKIMPGSYKMLKYKDGFAFKRYERL